MSAPDDAAMETLHRAMNWAEAPAGRCAACRAPATHHLVSPMGVISEPLCIDHAFEEGGAAGWVAREISGAVWTLALAAEVLRLRAERDALRAVAESIAAAARAYRDATDVPDGEYDATRHAEALAALSRVLGGGQ